MVSYIRIIHHSTSTGSVSFSVLFIVLLVGLVELILEKKKKLVQLTQRLCQMTIHTTSGIRMCSFTSSWF